MKTVEIHISFCLWKIMKTKPKEINLQCSEHQNETITTDLIFIQLNESFSTPFLFQRRKAVYFGSGMSSEIIYERLSPQPGTIGV